VIQNVVGGFSFAWPSFFKGAMLIDPTPSISNVKQFVYDGTSVVRHKQCTLSNGDYRSRFVDSNAVLLNVRRFINVNLFNALH
jgi:hypothetical protein